METVETMAVMAAAGVSGFALAFLMQWMLLRALFHVMPRRERTETSARASSINQQLHTAGSRAA